VFFGLGQESLPADADEDLGEEKAEMQRQDDMLQKLIVAQKEAMEQAESALALAQGAADPSR